MKILTPKTLKKTGIFIFSLLIAVIFITPSSVIAQSGAEVGGAGLGAASAIGPLGIAAIAAGTLGLVVIVAESVTDSDSTSKHTTPDHP